MRNRPKAFSNYHVRKRVGARVTDKDAVLVEAWVGNFWEEHKRGPTIDDYIAEAAMEGSEHRHLLPWDREECFRIAQRKRANDVLHCYEYVEISIETHKPVGDPLPGNISFEPITDEGVRDDVALEEYVPMFEVLGDDRLTARYLSELRDTLRIVQRKLDRVLDVACVRSEGYRKVKEGIEEIERDEGKQG